MPSIVDLRPAIACHCLAARRRARAITRFYEDKLRPHGLRATQFSILAALALKGPTPVSELAELLGLERTSLTRSAGVLERHGWVDVAPSDDGRQRRLRLTATGRRKVEAAFPAWRDAQEAVDRGEFPGWREAQEAVDRGEWRAPEFAPGSSSAKTDRSSPGHDGHDGGTTEEVASGR